LVEESVNLIPSNHLHLAAEDVGKGCPTVNPTDLDPKNFLVEPGWGVWQKMMTVRLMQMRPSLAGRTTEIP
jgi:hypothetical protein